jgi:hypothetical protein
MLETRIGKSGIRPYVKAPPTRYFEGEGVSFDLIFSPNSFQVEFTCLDWVANYEQTRWFLVLRAARPPDDALNRLLHLTNQIVRAFGQRALYVDFPLALAGRPPLPPPLPLPSLPLRGITPHATRGRGGAGARGKFSQPRKGAVRAGSSIPATGAGSYLCPDVSDKYHVSIGWILEKPNTERVERLRSLNKSEVDGSSGSGVRGMRVQFDSVKIKIGNTVTDVPLPTKAEEGRGLIGT